MISDPRVKHRLFVFLGRNDKTPTLVDFLSLLRAGGIEMREEVCLPLKPEPLGRVRRAGVVQNSPAVLIQFVPCSLSLSTTHPPPKIAHPIPPQAGGAWLGNRASGRSDGWLAGWLCLLPFSSHMPLQRTTQSFALLRSRKAALLCRDSLGVFYPSA